MIILENISDVLGFEAAIRGMRNSYDSWDKSDSWLCGMAGPGSRFVPGTNDIKLMKKLASAGPQHAKYRRMLHVSLDVTAPLYFWKEFETYRMGVERPDDIEWNSCSTMHTITNKEFSVEDFAYDHLYFEHDWPTDDICKVFDDPNEKYPRNVYPGWLLADVICMLNCLRELYLKETDAKQKKEYWYQIIQLLPSSYLQKRTVDINYEALACIYKYRRNHKLDEWQVFCDWIEKLPLAEGVIFPEKEDEASE